MIRFTPQAPVVQCRPDPATTAKRSHWTESGMGFWDVLPLFGLGPFGRVRPRNVTLGGYIVVQGPSVSRVPRAYPFRTLEWDPSSKIKPKRRVPVRSLEGVFLTPRVLEGGTSVSLLEAVPSPGLPRTNRQVPRGW